MNLNLWAKRLKSDLQILDEKLKLTQSKIDQELDFFSITNSTNPLYIDTHTLVDNKFQVCHFSKIKKKKKRKRV